MKTGTLQELNVQPGDVVQWRDCDAVTVAGWDLDRCYNTNQKFGGSRSMNTFTEDWRIISRASDTPKLWRDMTPEEKGALLLAAHEGKVIEHDDLTYTDGWEVARSPTWNENIAYRVKPDDVRETVVFDSKYYSFKLMEGYRITFETINGEPDPASIRMDKL